MVRPWVVGIISGDPRNYLIQCPGRFKIIGEKHRRMVFDDISSVESVCSSKIMAQILSGSGLPASFSSKPPLKTYNTARENSEIIEGKEEH